MKIIKEGFSSIIFFFQVCNNIMELIFGFENVVILFIDYDEFGFVAMGKRLLKILSD